MLVGVVSDTHGLLRPEVLPALHGVDHILHAGDVGDIGILVEMRKIAPVTAIRGNIDRSGPCAELPATEAVELGGCLIYMLHALEDLDVKLQTAGVDVVVYGHTHRPLVEIREGVLHVNPGSAGPRRFGLPVTLALLRVEDGRRSAELVRLLPG